RRRGSARSPSSCACKIGFPPVSIAVRYGEGLTSRRLPSSRILLSYLSYLSHPRVGTRLLKVVSGQNPREIALEILLQRQTGRFVENLLDSALNRTKLTSADRGLCQELVYGVVRSQATLDWLI